MKTNLNKTLLIVLSILLTTFVLTRLFRSPARESNLDKDLFGIDTAEIMLIKLQRAGQPELKLQKNDSAWTVTEKEQNARVETYAVNNLIRTLANLNPERIVSRKEEKRNTYLVDDSTSIRMTAYDRDAEEIVNWYVGKESQGMTFVRADDENEIYAIEGSLRSPLDKNFDEWRDKTFLKVTVSNINAITFKYPSDSGFVLKNNTGKWMIDDRQADSAMVQQYVNKLRSRKLNDFAKVPPSSDPDVTVIIEGGNAATIKAWKGQDDRWTLTSSVQPGVYFIDSRLPRDLFVGRTTFLPR